MAQKCGNENCRKQAVWECDTQFMGTSYFCANHAVEFLLGHLKLDDPMYGGGGQYWTPIKKEKKEKKITQKYLNKLLGTSVEKAKIKVEKDGYEFRSLANGTVTPNITRPYNVVEVYYDENNVIFQAFNQQVCDEFYQNKQGENNE